MLVSINAINLVAKWEGFRGKAYKCPAGVWTIGYGTTKWENGQPVKAGQTVTKDRALQLLKVQVQQHADTIIQYVKVPLNQNQYDALASFQYNLGKHILKGTTLLNYLNSKRFNDAANLMLQYNKAGGRVLQGLVNRRKEEVALFKKASTKSPTPPKQTIKKYASLVDLLKARGMDSSFTARRKLATQYGISYYTGTATQNMQLLNILQK